MADARPQNQKQSPQQASATALYTCLCSISYAGKSEPAAGYAHATALPGELVELTADDAKSLLAQGAVEPAK